MAKNKGEDLALNMTPMIDVVFQLIIFFVVTVKLEADMTNEKIKLADSPHGPMIVEKDPRTVIIEVDDRGLITIARVRMTATQLNQVMQQAVGIYGQNVPVLIRGDRQTKHSDVRRAMDACSAAGVWKIKFAALKEKAK